MNKHNFWTYLAIGFIPDIAISWTYMTLTEESWSTFWWGLLALSAIQMFVSIKQWASGSLIFRLALKEQLSEALAKEMIHDKFPRPDRNEDWESFLSRLVTDETLPVDIRLKANCTLGAIQAHKSHGFFASLRMEAAGDLAMKKFMERSL